MNSTIKEKLSECSIYTKILIYVGTAMALILACMELFSILYIRQQQKRVMISYQDTVDFYADYWGTKLSLADQSLLVLLNSACEDYYYATYGERTKLEYELAGRQLMQKLEETGIVYSNELYFFYYQPEREIYIDSGYPAVSTVQRKQLENSMVQNIDDKTIDYGRDWTLLDVDGEKYLYQIYLTEERLEEALIRILGLKAALKLPEAKVDGSIYRDLEEARKIVGCEEHKEIERESSDKAVTLVKNLENLIPIDPVKKRRVLLHGLTTEKGYFGDGGMNLEGQFKQELEKEGFGVTIYEPGKGMEGMVTPCSKTIDNYDLIIYVADLQTKSNQTTVRIEWKAPMGGDAPSFIQDVPTLFISFANPYHLQDVPKVKTFINAYKWKEANIRAVIDKLLGRSDFRGVSPVDAFCGMWDTRL